jgi:protease II
LCQETKYTHEKGPRLDNHTVPHAFDTAAAARSVIVVVGDDDVFVEVDAANLHDYILASREIHQCNQNFVYLCNNRQNSTWSAFVKHRMTAVRVAMQEAKDCSQNANLHRPLMDMGMLEKS